MSEYTREQLERVGGSYWQTSDGSKRRVYFNRLSELYGLSYATYNSGNISSATLNGEIISNNKARHLAATLDAMMLWYDLSDGLFHWKVSRNEDQTIARHIVDVIKTAVQEDR